MKSILYPIAVLLAALPWFGEPKLAELKLAEPKPVYSAAEKQIFEQLNQERQKAGLAALEWNDRVADAARSHAQLLAEHAELSHQYPGEAPLPERIGATGARFTLAAENVARTEYVEDVHLALMNSPGHRATMLSRKYNAAGIGVAEREGRVYVAQDFIFQVPAYSESEFGAAFIEAFNLARKSRRIREIDAHTEAYFHDLACSTDGEAAKLAGKISGARSLVVFTASEPHSLPEQLLGRAANADFHHLTFGVCFRPDQEHGYANFWVVAAFGS
jgi:hypothetical protein